MEAAVALKKIISIKNTFNWRQKCNKRRSDIGTILDKWIEMHFLNKANWNIKH